MNTTGIHETEFSGPRGPRGCGRHHGGSGPGFGGPFTGAFTAHWAERFAGRLGHGGPSAWRRVPVNIEETADAFVLSLYAAGLDKNGIGIGVRGDVLTIRYQPAQADEDSRRFTRRELPQTGFTREFALNGKVEVDGIAASYSDGVLTVRLPKTPSAMQPEHSIPVQ